MRLGVTPEALDAYLAEKGARGERDKSESVPADWKDLTISFMSPTEVQARLCTESVRNFSYAQMGFAHGHTGGPRQAWFFLQELAQKNGVIEVPYIDRRTLDSRAKEVRNALRTFVKNEWKNYRIPEKSLPLSYRKSKGNRRFETAFKIGLGSSFK